MAQRISQKDNPYNAPELWEAHEAWLMARARHLPTARRLRLKYEAIRDEIMRKDVKAEMMKREKAKAHHIPN